MGLPRQRCRVAARDYALDPGGPAFDVGAARGEADEVAQCEMARGAGDDKDGGGETLAEGVGVDGGRDGRLVVGV